MTRMRFELRAMCVAAGARGLIVCLLLVYLPPDRSEGTTGAQELIKRHLQCIDGTFFIETVNDDGSRVSSEYKMRANDYWVQDGTETYWHPDGTLWFQRTWINGDLDVERPRNSPDALEAEEPTE